MAVELPREAASKMLASTTNRERVTGEAGEYRDRLVEFVLRQGIELEFREGLLRLWESATEAGSRCWLQRCVPFRSSHEE
jgi:hypothetical protein